MAKMRSVIKNKKGFLRIIEAVIAILLILGVLIFVTVRNKTRAETDLTNKIPPLLDEIAKSAEWRDRVVTTGMNEPEKIAALKSDLKTQFLAARITNPRIKYEIEICQPLDQTCALTGTSFPSGANVYVGERVISAVLPEYDAKKVKIFLWMKE